ncbi:MAG: family 1 glycosylhydrolase [Nibricoccus sp.]
MNFSPTLSRPPLEIWGGIECSFVRLQNHCSDQLARTGHAERLDDLDRLAGLGLRTLRYPILWERHASDPIDWRWADERLKRLRELGIRPIVGLLHHGCGPLPDGFLDSDFVDGFARFARAVAERFPWIDAYTPINEPLTTARFSGMYGLWHPLRCDLPSFARILLSQCQAIRAAMAAIREINPTAQLIQTEDVGKTHSTPLLSYQADLENERRWLSLDLLYGCLREGAPMYEHLLDAGLEGEELDSFVESPCQPDLIGMNHYVTSERLLDENLKDYPRAFHGGNERHAYADVPAVRARAEGAVGPAQLLREVWERYQLPIAITEVQLACTREEQLRWLQEMWQAAEDARSTGADVRAVTAWALLGAYDWDSLLVETNGHYENGAFDVHDGTPRLTAIGHAIRSLATHGHFEHPAATGPGWWRRPVRLIFPPVACPRTGRGTAVSEPKLPSAERPLLIIGATERLQSLLRRACRIRGLSAVFLGHDGIDLSDPKSCGYHFRRYKPWGALVALPNHSNEDICAGSAQHAALIDNLRAISLGERIGVAILSDEPIMVDNEGWSFLTAHRNTDVLDSGESLSPESAINIRAGARPIRRKNHAIEANTEIYFPTRIDAALNLLIDDYGSGGLVFAPMGETQLLSS